MNQINWFVNVSGFFILILMVALLALPYFLVIYFPESGSYISEIAKSVTPWSVILLLVLVFHEQIKSVVVSIGALIQRTKRGELGPLKFDSQQSPESSQLSQEQVDLFRESISKMEQEKNQAVQALKFYFHRTLYLTIYRSQIELLQFLVNAKSPVDQGQLKIFYEVAIARNPSLKNYPFERYVGYLRENFLTMVHPDGKISITPAGEDFIHTLGRDNVSLEVFSN